MLYLVAHRDLVLDHQQSIRDAGVALENNPVGMADMLNDLLVEPLMSHDKGVNAIIGDRLLGRHDIGRYVFLEAATGLYHRPGSYAASLAYQDISAEYHVVFHPTIAGDLGAVTEDTVVADMGVMGHMHALMQEVSAANHGASFRECGTVNHDVLADDIIIPDIDDRISPLIIEILRFRTDNSSVKHPVSTSHTGTAHHARMRHDHTVVADLHIFINICERVDRHIFSDLRA